jgi:hypothetical protein
LAPCLAKGFFRLCWVPKNNESHERHVGKSKGHYAVLRELADNGSLG